MSQQLSLLPSWILSSAAMRSHQILHRQLSSSGVDGYEYRCIAALATKAQLSQAELGISAMLDPRDVTHTVRALEERGLVLREKDPNHGRKILVSLTAAGRSTAKKLAPVMAEIQEQIFKSLKLEDRSNLLKLLERVGR
jgi:DNA-binding MarR family transcriptional regulator